MEFLRLLTVLSLLFIYACSKSQDSKDASDGEDIEMVDGEEDESGDDVEVVDSEEGYGDEEDEELAEDSEDIEDEEFAEDEEGEEDEEFAEDGEEGEEDEEFADGLEDSKGVEELEAAEEQVADTSSSFESIDGAPLADVGSSSMPTYNESSSVNIADAGPTSSYSVQSNETLMLISFKLYGDYTRWKEIQRLNSDKLGGSTVISPGMNLTYNTQGSGFVWNPQGNPYLIQRGDTLGIISDKVYRTMSKWKKIWNNNRPLIKDPNKIYAGFTIYYIPENGRVLASEQVTEAAPPIQEDIQAQQEQAMAPEEESMDEDFPDEI